MRPLPLQRAGPERGRQQRIAQGRPRLDTGGTRGIARLERRYAFGNFLEALDFTNRVGREAQDEDHHPALLTEWGAVTVSWWTHNIGGLHRNDFIMAARTDAVALAANV